MMPGRIALHEAAHAVTGETMFPGCVEYVDMCPVPGKSMEWAASLGLSKVDAYVRWNAEGMSMIDYGTMCYAGKWGEIIAGADDWADHIKGDLAAIRQWVPPLVRGIASRRAKRIVRSNWATVVAVAEVLDRNPIVFGDTLREVIRARHA